MVLICNIQFIYGLFLNIFCHTQSDITDELSTTIVQASPVLSEEKAVEKLREKGPFQSRKKRTLSYTIQKNLDTEKVTETTSLSSKPEDVKPNFRLGNDLSCKSRDLSETNVVGLTSNPSELDQINLGLLSKSGLSHLAVSVMPRLPVSRQAPVNEGERGTSEDPSTADSALGGQVPHQVASGNQCAAVPSTVACGSFPEMQNVPTTVPTLLTRHSFTAAPLAQQYLGTLPSAGDVALPQCHAGTAAVCGFSGSYPYPVVTGEHVQNSVAVGICLGQNIGSGLMGTSSLCNPYSNALNQNLLSTAKPFPVQSVGANQGIKPWDSGMTSGFGKILFLC